MIRPLSVLSLVCTLVWLMSPLAAADEQSAIAAVESAGGTVRLIAKDSTG